MFLILTLSMLAATAGVYVIQNQPPALITGTANGHQQQLTSVLEKSSQLLAYPERDNYQTIPLESINSAMQGSDPANLALNMLNEVTSVAGKSQIEVAYPQPNQALVTITQINRTKNNTVGAIKYRVEMNRFGRSLLVSSPPVWEIIWAGSQVQCFSKGSVQNKLGQNCN
nr:hypothetical protein [Anabaena cylindrica]